MVYVGLLERDLKNFWGARQNFEGAVVPPGTPLAPPLLLSEKCSLKSCAHVRPHNSSGRRASNIEVHTRLSVLNIHFEICSYA